MNFVRSLTPASIRHLLIDYPQLAQVVTAQFVRETYSVTELLEYARGYADREDSVFDKSGELALMERLKVIAGNQERNKKRIVEMIVNNAIEKAEKKSMRKLFQSKYDKTGWCKKRTCKNSSFICVLFCKLGNHAVCPRACV